MRNRIVTMIVSITLSAALATPAFAGVPEIGDDINAKIARAKVQKPGTRGTKVEPVKADQPGGRGGDVLGDGCNIAIGNVFEQKGSGFGTSAQAQTTVVVQGDVIMANNRCK
ncbi:MAG: hypothetical protein U5L03_15605 [Burkholderiaceae bacterium]|nr:hypothetical protein [Burkholderiaceae bacterium]